ncbi:ParA family protein (plasmid) [Skermanella sp. TT6]|uniref:ParA family protein n=1 Tax=Skermanella cutis TaxID=2775420 RepID=A0ABX7BHX8_9PROT|nr:ParA family protein [Skermanella sp. TT6]QQP93990.1 ParA family protein [Skermanella sp. TT6]
MIVVSAISQKGGVGKSSIARLVAREYAASGWAVRVADFDLKQMTTTEWGARRLAAGIEPAIEVQGYASVDKALQGAKAADMLVMDGRGFADKLSQDMARASNKVLLPTGLALDDLRPSVRLAHELVNAGVQARNLAFVLCRTGDSDKEIASARQYIEGAGYRCLEAPWPERTGYRDSHDQGKAGSEALHPSLRTKAEAVAKAVVDFIGED